MDGDHDFRGISGRGPRLPARPIRPIETRPRGRSGRNLAGLIVRSLIGLAAAVAFLVSGLLLLLNLALTPKSGDEFALSVMKVIDVAGWIAIGFWLLVDWVHVRLRVIAPPVVAWLWTLSLAASMSGLGYLNWGP